MDELTAKIEETVSALLQYDMQRYGKLAQEMVNMMISLFPVIIDSYNNPKMEDLRGDATYWPGQLQRIIDALGSGDYYEVADVLYNETMQNILELKGVLEDRGLL